MTPETVRDNKYDGVQQRRGSFVSTITGEVPLVRVRTS